MINVPKITKAERDLTGLFSVTFEDLDPEAKEKTFTKCFGELRAGIAWPVRNVGGYMCILGLYSGVRFGTENSLMLVYEKQYATTPEIILDAYHRAHDLHFQQFYTDCSRVEWRGFVHEFQRSVNGALGARNIRLLQCPFPQDFALAGDVLRKLKGSKAITFPTASLLMEQLGSITKAQLDTDSPEYKWPALTGFRFVSVAWQVEGWNQRMGRPAETPDVGPLGWA